jgi:NTE family protein
VDEELGFLAGVPILAGAADETLDELRRSLRRVEVPARRFLFRAGEEADRLYIVRSGRLEVLAEGADGPRVVRVVGPGAALGELALLTGRPRSASVRAVRDSEVLELDAERFEDALAADPALARAVARSLARQLQESGGLEPPPARPSVFAVLAPRGAFWDELAASFGACGTLAALDGSEGRPDLDRLEREHDHVLLLAAPDADRAWRDFCLRQADRILVVAGGTAPSVAADGPPVDVVFLRGGSRGGSVESWIDAVGAKAHHVVGPGEVGRVVRRLTRRSLGLVLSGGGARGFAHIGVVGVLQQEGLEVDRVGGCSIGALIGALAAEGRRADEIRDVCAGEFVRRTPFNDYTLPRVSLIRARKARRMLERLFGDARVEELPRPLYTVSADLLSSRLIVHARGPIVDAVGASMSIPGIAPPLPHDGGLLVDGGVLNNLPVDLMAEADEGPIVAVDVIRRMPDGTVEPALPTITETLSRATVLGSVERAARNRTLAHVVVTPDVQDIPLRNFRALDRAIEAGRRAAEQTLESGGKQALLAALGAPFGATSPVASRQARVTV